MSNEVPHDLLRPSLSRNDAPRLAPYSQQAGFLTAFFGGPPAALFMAGVNAQRMGRLQKDLPWLIAMGVLFVVMELALLQTDAGRAAATWMQSEVGWRTYHKLLGLVFFGVASLAHVREQRAATLMGADRPSGWWMGVFLSAIGFILTSVLHEVCS